MPLYESYCSKCKYQREYYTPIVTEATEPCAKCGRETQRVPSTVVFHDWHQLTKTTLCTPYVTNNIARDGKPIEIRSHAQLEKACRDNGVTPAFGKDGHIG